MTTVEAGSGRTPYHCGWCGAHKPVPSLAWLCEQRHLQDALTADDDRAGCVAPPT